MKVSRHHVTRPWTTFNFLLTPTSISSSPHSIKCQPTTPRHFNILINIISQLSTTTDWPGRVTVPRRRRIPDACSLTCLDTRVDSLCQSIGMTRGYTVSARLRDSDPVDSAVPLCADSWYMLLLSRRVQQHQQKSRLLLSSS